MLFGLNSEVNKVVKPKAQHGVKPKKPLPKPKPEAVQNEKENEIPEVKDNMVNPVILIIPGIIIGSLIPHINK